MHVWILMLIRISNYECMDESLDLEALGVDEYLDMGWLWIVGSLKL